MWCLVLRNQMIANKNIEASIIITPTSLKNDHIMFGMVCPNNSTIKREKEVIANINIFQISPLGLMSLSPLHLFLIVTSVMLAATANCS